jgi:predicted O-methyltransferase YrrM
MTTLIQKPLSSLLERLFQDADASERVFEQEMEDIPPEQRAADRADYRQFYARLRDQPLPVSRATGTFLYILARSIGAQNVVEFGTSFGISTLHLAAALRDNGGGRLIGSEFEPSKVARARENLAAANLSDLVDIREGDALETFAHDLPESIDLILLDGAKNLYPSILSLLESRLRVGALIVADNADASPDYVARVRSIEHGYLSVPFAEDVELSMRIGAPESGSASQANSHAPIVRANISKPGVPRSNRR